MKKINKVFLYLSFITSLSGCNLLDREPLDIISDEAVWSDENLITGYLLGLYNQAPTRREFNGGFDWGPEWDDYNAEGSKEPCQYSVLSDEARSGYNWCGSVLLNTEGFKRDTKYLEYWDYSLIRNCNFMIEKINSGNLEDKEKEIYSAEARFLRALAYFELVKRYGGVPLIKEVQNLDTPHDELFPKRAKEEEIYDFIIKECDEISKILPDRIQTGRADKFTALALLSRASLYAGSIAKYGKIQLEGVLGISKSPDYYYDISLKASTSIINEGGYSLYKVHADKVENYRQLFLDDNNTEVIFKRSFDGVSKGHSYNYFNVIQGYGAGWGSYLQPSVNLVDAYDFIDGTDGTIDWDNTEGAMKDILKNKDPRFHATFFYQGLKYPNAENENDSICTYIIYGDPDGDGTYKYMDDNPNGYTEWKNFYDDGTSAFIQNCGRNSVPVSVDGAYTGFFIRKFIKEDEIRANAWQSSTDWYEFRLAEIYLNQAEAALEMSQSQPSIALSAINEIRERAGVKELENITIEKVRKERQVELAFEAHRVWDLRRWRIAKDILNKPVYGIQAIWKLPDNKFTYKKYSADTRQTEGLDANTPRFFSDRMYYLPLGEERINNNPNLSENPEY